MKKTKYVIAYFCTDVFGVLIYFFLFSLHANHSHQVTKHQYHLKCYPSQILPLHNISQSLECKNSLLKCSSCSPFLGEVQESTLLITPQVNSVAGDRKPHVRGGSLDGWDYNTIQWVAELSYWILDFFLWFLKWMQGNTFFKLNYNWHVTLY